MSWYEGTLAHHWASQYRQKGVWFGTSREDDLGEVGFEWALKGVISITLHPHQLSNFYLSLSGTRLWTSWGQKMWLIFCNIPTICISQVFIEWMNIWMNEWKTSGEVQAFQAGGTFVVLAGHRRKGWMHRRFFSGQSILAGVQCWVVGFYSYYGYITNHPKT